MSTFALPPRGGAPRCQQQRCFGSLAVPDPRENLAGLVERTSFHTAESGLCVLRLKARG